MRSLLPLALYALLQASEVSAVQHNKQTEKKSKFNSSPFGGGFSLFGSGASRGKSGNRFGGSKSKTPKPGKASTAGKTNAIPEKSPERSPERSNEASKPSSPAKATEASNRGGTSAALPGMSGLGGIMSMFAGKARPPSTSPAYPEFPFASRCCAILYQTLPGKVSNPAQQAAYRAALNSYFATGNREVYPACFVQPESSADVATILKVITEANEDKPNSCQFAIRSGGHTPIADYNNIQGGITVDLTKLNQVRLFTDRKTVAIGPGNRWKDVYSVLDAEGLGTTGGRVSTVGVGGLVTGGGVSFFTPRYGFVCDNVRNFEVVLANGDVVNANNATNPDLFKALKGGSGNFGMVTRIDLATFEQGLFYGGTAYILNPIYKYDLLDYFEQFNKKADPYAHLIFSVSYVYNLGLTTTATTANFHYTKITQEDTPPAFKKLIDSATFTTARRSNTIDFTDEISKLDPENFRHLFMSFSHQNSAAFMDQVIDISKTHFDRIKSKVSGLTWSASFQPLSSKTLQKSKLLGGNSLGLEDAGDTTFVLLTAGWTNESGDKLVNAAAKAFYEDVAQAAKRAGKYSRFIYLNYAARFQDPIQGYGPENAANLAAAALKYDPTGVFQTQTPGGFKIRAAAQRSSRPGSQPDTSPEDSRQAKSVWGGRAPHPVPGSEEVDTEEHGEEGSEEEEDEEEKRKRLEAELSKPSKQA